MKKMNNAQDCFQLPKALLEMTGLDQMNTLTALAVRKALLFIPRDASADDLVEIGCCLGEICQDYDIPLGPKGVFVSSSELMDAGLPSDPALLDVYLEDGRIIIEAAEDSACDADEELLDDALEEALGNLLETLFVLRELLYKSVEMMQDSACDADESTTKGGAPV